ncbi:MAG: hypothetical protein HQL44_17240 [Alphaproteobacteria bacterium]|nr:hypothetical protein [Alphaproteobacteria bacterium]
MAGITLAQAETYLAQWLEAQASLAASQSYSIETATGTKRQLTRANLAEVQKMIEFWDAQCKRLGGTANTDGIRTKVITAI